MRVLQDDHVLGRLSSVRRQGNKLTAIWNGPPPPFAPNKQIEPLVLESDDGLERQQGWLLSVVLDGHGHGQIRVEIGSEPQSAPPWHRSQPSEPARSSLGAVEQSYDILVVDDDAETLSLVGAALEEQGWQVRSAAGGREALAMASDRPPDVAVVDLIMPEVGGEEVCAMLRQNPKFARTRILILSASEDTRQVAAACDADSAVVKPFTSELLVHEVRRLVGR